ncbi:MAG: hypothetical protein JKX71_10085 [Amylibacter sp.]|nr:hypothetical protein [Amylibacter sp.]
MDQIQTLIKLAEDFAAHENKTHWSVSMRIFGKGNFFANLMKPGGDCHTRTADRVIKWFAENWPEDLAWPKGIDRPSKSKKKVA